MSLHLEAHAELIDIPGVGKLTRQTLKRLIDLYDAWSKPEKAAEWRAKLATEQEAVASDKAGESSFNEKQDE